MLKENDDCKVRRAIVIPQPQRSTVIGGFESMVGWREVYFNLLVACLNSTGGHRFCAWFYVIFAQNIDI